VLKIQEEKCLTENSIASYLLPFMKAKIVIFGTTLLIWGLVFFIHGYYQVKRNIALDGYGYEVDWKFLVFGFIFSWAMYYLLALFLIVLGELFLISSVSINE
jgi:uncharacterized protein HemY